MGYRPKLSTELITSRDFFILIASKSFTFGSYAKTVEN